MQSKNYIASEDINSRFLAVAQGGLLGHADGIGDGRRTRPPR